MPVSQQVNRSHSTYRRSGQDPFVNVLEFAESPQFCGFRLFPMQRFLLKLVYGLDLSDNLLEPIILRDEFNEKVNKTFDSEQEFLEYLYDNNHINSKSFNYPLVEIYLMIGRRGTKTTISDIVAAYSLYQLNTLDDPYAYFGVLPITEIGVALVSNNETNAERQSRELANLVYRNPFFKPFLVQKDPPVSGFQLKTLPMVNSRRADFGKLSVAVMAASPSVRGASNVVVICDEFAHYIDSDMSTKKNPLDEYIYGSLTPSIANFRDNQGRPFGKAIFITSPNGKKGRCWKVYNENRDNPDRIVLNVPTWWSNPHIASVYLRSMYKESERFYKQEYGAEFVEQTGGGLKALLVESAREPGLECTTANANKSYWYYAGLDLALSSDAVAIAICHYETHRDRKVSQEIYEPMVKSEGVYVFDYVWYQLPVDGDEIQVDDVVSLMVYLSKAYNIRKWVYDQWSAKMFRQWLQKSGFKGALEEITATQVWNSDAARFFKVLLNDGKLVIPDDQSLVDELVGLSETINRTFIKLENPTGHDDRFSAMLKALWVCHSDPRKESKRDVAAMEKMVRQFNKKVLSEHIARRKKSSNLMVR